MMSFREKFSGRLRLPLIAAPMLRVSGPELVIAASRAGVIGAFPTANAGSPDELEAWLQKINAELAETPGFGAPICPNLIIRHSSLADDLTCLLRNKVEIVITSVGSPAAVVKPLHDIGCVVLADVASIRHAEKAIEAGADGLILLTAGAGGNTGWANSFAFVRAVRRMFDGIIVLAGGVSDGQSLYASQVLGCDLAYMGTSFIATRESMASDNYRAMLVASTLDDVMTTRAFSGLQANMLRPSIVAAGLDPERLDEQVSAERAKQQFGGGAAGVPSARPRRWVDIWSAGHSVSGVTGVNDVASLVGRVEQEYRDAKQAARRDQ
jgi:nitronate monooxygenase